MIEIRGNGWMKDIVERQTNRQIDRQSDGLMGNGHMLV